MDWYWINLAFLITLLVQYSNHMVKCDITDVRLVGGPASNKGTVEIKQDGGDWETTCGINLGFTDVIVICRQLGFAGASLTIETTPYGQNSSPYIGLNCYGSEGNLSACSTSSHTSECSPAGAASCHGDGYLGCFVDMISDRVLSGDSLVNISMMTIPYCIQFCQGSTTANYVYAGVKNGNECYCGKASDNYTRHGVGVDADCSFPCHGDPSESCGGSGYIAVFTTTSLLSTTSIVTSTNRVPTTSNGDRISSSSPPPQPSTSSPPTPLSSPLLSSCLEPQGTSNLHTAGNSTGLHGLGVVLGEGVVIIILSVLIIVLVIYIIRIRRMMKDLKKDQKTQHVDLVQSSGSSEKDTGFYHDIQDVMKSDPTTTSDGGTYYSSQIYEHKRANVLDPDDTSAPHHSYMI